MKENLSRFTKIVYGAGDLGFGLITKITGAKFLFFLTDVIGISPAVVGIDALFVDLAAEMIQCG